MFWGPPVKAVQGTGVADGKPTERSAGSAPSPGTPASPGDGSAARHKLHCGSHGPDFRPSNKPGLAWPQLQERA